MQFFALLNHSLTFLQTTKNHLFQKLFQIFVQARVLERNIMLNLGAGEQQVDLL